MSDMVERVAKAVYEALTYEAVGVKPKWVERGNSLKQGEARKYARAAIEAMREPTDKMAEDGAIEVASTKRGAWFCWQAMIDAALEADK